MGARTCWLDTTSTLGFMVELIEANPIADAVFEQFRAAGAMPHIGIRRAARFLNDAQGVQAHDVPWAGLVTMGEAWHNNHHAFPGSARLGLYPGQSDWGFAFIRLLERAGLAWSIRTPGTLPDRAALRAIHA